uniref:Dynein heavy chain ATP-binding dynein motor region domain-containing protein n=1 Tax=Chelydra serpentina TaxID=8475 RepID=A0A8C3S1K9_CHESE
IIPSVPFLYSLIILGEIGDKECKFHPKFWLILLTQFANPHYKPEIQAQNTLINFTVTQADPWQRVSEPRSNDLGLRYGAKNKSGDIWA